MENFLSEYSSDDFNPIKYINENFPDEASLAGLDSHIQQLEDDLSSINKEIVSAIQEHALLNMDVKAQLDKTRKNVKNILQDIDAVKIKAKSSETLVAEMCKDIKSLDIAKKNLTFGIQTHKKYILMANALDKLREFCEVRQYREVASLISAIDEFFTYFKQYDHIAQIQSIIKDKETIMSELKCQIREDFIAWGQGATTFGKETMQDACVLIETLGLAFRNEIINLMCEIILTPYNEEFSKYENSTLEIVERRYAWLKRRLKEIEAIYDDIFPHYWGVKCFIVHDFCGTTRVHITNILEQRPTNDVVGLLKALESTLVFEKKINQTLTDEYKVYVEGVQKENEEKDDLDNVLEGRDGNHKYKNVPESSKEFVIASLPKFKGSISDSFEQYMSPYIEKEEYDARETILKALAQDQYDPNSEVKVLDSSLTMFNVFKAIMKRASRYSRSQTMFNIWKVFQRCMRLYVDEALVRLSKEERSKGKDEEGFEIFACLITNTGDYCKETLGGLVDTIRQYLDSPFSDQVSAEEGENLFIAMLNKGTDALLVHMDGKTDNAFANIHKQDWSKLNEVGDTSNYVKEVSMILTDHIKIVKDVINDMYFVYYLNKLVDVIQNKFLNSLYKTKKLTDIAIQRFQLDVFELKTLLTGLLSVNTTNTGRKRSNSSASSGVQKSFINYVNKKLTRTENILKLLAMNNEQFLKNVKSFFQDPTAPELEKLMTLKGFKKGDITNFFRQFST